MTPQKVNRKALLGRSLPLVLIWLFVARALVAGSAVSVGVRTGAAASLVLSSYSQFVQTDLLGQGAGAVTPYPCFSFQVDAYGRVLLGSFLALETGLSVCQVGGGFMASGATEELVGISVTELAFPLVVVLLLRTGIGTFGLSLGAMAAIPLEAPVLVAKTNLASTQTTLTPASSFTGLVAGVSLQREAGPGSLSFDLRYIYRLQSIVTKLPAEQGSVAPVTLEASVGYLFTF